MIIQKLYIFASGIYLGLSWRQYPSQWSLARKFEVSAYVVAFWPACLALHFAYWIIDRFRQSP